MFNHGLSEHKFNKEELMHLASTEDKYDKDAFLINAMEANMSETEVMYVKKGAGMTAGIIACVLAVLGILFFGTIFVPLAAIVAILGTIIAMKNKNGAGIGVNALAWVLTVVGLFTSPVLLGIIGFASSS